MLSNLKEWIDMTSQSWTIMVAILIVFGLVCAFFGYRLVRLLIALQGFLVGGIASLIILSQTTELAGWPLVLICVAIGLVLGALSYFLFRLGLFLLAGVAAFLVIGGVLGSFMTNFTVCCALAVGGGVVVGILALVFTRPVIIIATACGGGWLAAEHLLRDVIFASAAAPLWLLYVAAIVLIALGIYVQFAHTAKGK